MNKRLSFLFCFFVVTLILTAQNKVRIFGYVVDSNNRGIELVNVFLKGTTTGTTTNQNGYYELITEIKDSAEIIFSMVGYQTVSYTIHPKAKVIQLTVELPALNQEIKEIDIVGQKRQTNTIDVLNPS
ncbi:MAG TPA: carboxypeptidase-like regulatory domain-containing protein, partial [Paludibacteraceae bacterium]|nr:carboxypeptidase-like regulatory domain-containing protein [Paludibacteraceae bacterium]